MAEKEQRDGLNRVAGSPGVLEYGGVSYQLSPPSLGDHGELRAWIVSQRKSPVEVLPGLLAKTPEHMHEMLTRVAFSEAARQRTVTADELREYLNSFEGTTHILWFMLRKAHPELTLERVREIWSAYRHEQMLNELQARMDQATGFIADQEALGNSPGQSQQQPAAA